MSGRRATVTATATATAEAAGGCTGGADAPKNRVKFLCSYGGRILPRPSDGYFKYVGGDTRVLAVSRSISFNELKKTIQDMFRADVVIKYQLADVELDVLVTVAGDEDLVYMLEEYDRLDARHPNSPSSSSSPRFRLFIFPSSSMAAPQLDVAAALDQPSCVADAGNGNGKRSIFTISTSARTSPTSSVDGLAAVPSQRKSSLEGEGLRMHRARSTPNLGRHDGSDGSLVSLVHPTGMHQCRHQPHYQHEHPNQHVHWQHGHGHGVAAAAYGQQQLSAPACGDSCRMATPAFRYEMCWCGCGCRVAVPPQPQPTLRGGHHYPPAPTTAGHGGSVSFGNAGEISTGHPQKGFHTTTTTASRVGPPSSPRGAAVVSSPSAGAFPRHLTWEQMPQ